MAGKVTSEITEPQQQMSLASSGTLRRLARPAIVLIAALASRMLAAVVLQVYIQRARTGRLCVFPDTEYYWMLAQTIRHGRPYEIIEGATTSFRAMRTPGYPLFLAACQAIFGESTLAVRLVQAVLGAASVGMIFLLARRLDSSSRPRVGAGPVCPVAALAAAALAAIDPYYVGISELLLSEALFIPLTLACLWGLAVLWREHDEPESIKPSSRMLIAIAAGAAGGGAVLTRPSFLLFLPAALICWLVIRAFSHDRRLFREAIQCVLLFTIGFVIVMSPWWRRNARTYGRFVATSVWLGASLFDGLSPSATGASDMRFREAADIRALGEIEQDRELTRRALEFVRENPGRTLQLGLIKLGRYWSPWPNASELQSSLLAVASTVIVIPVYVLLLAGVWNRRRDPRALVLAAGPLIYFCAVHLVFVSSIRYRIPGEMIAAPLAGIGLRSILRRVQARASQNH